MTEQLGRSGDGSALDILGKLELKRAAAKQQIAAMKDSNAAMRCDALRSLFDDQYLAIRGSVTPLEQMKGVAAGFELAAKILLTHCDLWKTELAEIEQADQLELALKVVNRGVQSILDAARKQRGELGRKAGEFDGAVNSARAALERIEKVAENLKRAEVKAAEIDQSTTAGDEVDTALEAQAEKRRQQVEGATVTPIAAAKKKTAKKKGPQRRKTTTKKKT